MHTAYLTLPTGEAHRLSPFWCCHVKICLTPPRAEACPLNIHLGLVISKALAKRAKREHAGFIFQEHNVVQRMLQGNLVPWGSSPCWEWRVYRLWDLCLAERGKDKEAEVSCVSWMLFLTKLLFSIASTPGLQLCHRHCRNLGRLFLLFLCVAFLEHIHQGQSTSIILSQQWPTMLPYISQQRPLPRPGSDFGTSLRRKMDSFAQVLI